MIILMKINRIIAEMSRTIITENIITIAEN